MRKFTLACLLILTSASSALALRLAQPAAPWQIAANTNTDPTGSAAAGAVKTLVPLTIQGVTTQLDMEDEQTEKAIEAAWNAFDKSDAVHSAVNWHKPVFIYAVYTPLEGDQYQLTIGYPLDRQISEASTATVPPGSYQVHTPASLAERDIMELWESLYRARTNDSVQRHYMERYQLDSKGEVEAVSLWVQQ